jgi:Right handed beta helix region/Pel9A-like, right handed beta helix region
MLRLGCLFALLASVLSAATFYVSTQGSDNNPGTSQAPWATLQHAVDSIAPGDTILVTAGTYVGCRIGIPGGTSSPKTLQAAPGAAVLIDAPGPANRHNSIIEVENFSTTMTDWVIGGFEIANSPKYGIDVRVTDRITVQGNHVHDSALTGIFTAFSNDVLIQNNETDHNHEHGIYQSNSSTHPTIRGNNSHDNASAGIHMNGDLSQVPPGSKKHTGLVQFATVEGNTIWNNGTSGGSGINCDGVDDSVISNNLLYNNYASGISLYAIDGAHGSSNNMVYNNTIVMAPNSRFVINIPNDGGGKKPPVGNVVENNILYTPDASHGSVLIAKATVAGFHSDHNIVVNVFSANNDASVISLAKWQTHGYDVHSKIATPAQLFVDPANNNYQLKAGSPVIDDGTALTAVPTDIVGVTRPQGSGYDVGAYETF